jgi:hypothetical protein
MTAQGSPKCESTQGLKTIVWPDGANLDPDVILATLTARFETILQSRKS